jgi:hypothetical protein
MRRIAFSVILLVSFFIPFSISAAQTTPNVIATHYPDFGGTDPAPRDSVAVSYGVYNNRLNDYHAVNQSRMNGLVDSVERETGYRPVILNDWTDVVEYSAELQIVNNVPVEGALYTIFLPPGWNRDANLPVLLSGNGASISNNSRLYGDRETITSQIAVLNLRNGGTGFIVATSNCGGTESQGVDEPTMRSVGAFLNWIDQNGGDKQNVITAGGSRGGGSALMWAINPLGLDYDVHTVFAVVPPTHYGSLSQVSVLTYPAMASIGALVSHDDQAWRYVDSEAAVNRPAVSLEALIGTGDPAEADARSPIGLAERLVGKQVLIAAGAHDAYFPLSHFMAFDRRLTALDMAHTTIVTLANGHESSDFFEEILFLYLANLSTGLRVPLPDGRFFFIDVDPRRDEQISLSDFFDQRGIAADPGEMPVVAQFPYKASYGSPINVEVCGTPGDVIDLSARTDTGEGAYTLQVTLDENECHVEQIIPEGSDASTWEWRLLVNGVEINPLNTPTRAANGCGMRAVTTILPEQPHPRQTIAWDGDLSFGLDEFSGQPESCRVE